MLLDEMLEGLTSRIAGTTAWPRRSLQATRQRKSDVGERQPQVRLHRLAELRQARLRLAVEQPPAELLFESADRIGHRGLRDAAALGRPGEMQLVAQGEEIDDLVGVHAVSPFPIDSSALLLLGFANGSLVGQGDE
jgi:hypothetical protein